MGTVPSRAARLAHARRHAELWNAGEKDAWVASWRTIIPGDVRMFDPVGTEEKRGFEVATVEAWDMFQHLLRIEMLTVQVNGDEMAWVCVNHFGTEPDLMTAYSIETFAWDRSGDLLIKTYYPMPESLGADEDPYAHLLATVDEPSDRG
ncbi:MAG: hypothetical protein PGN29_07470 [Gordonia paraffinivorans]